MKAEGDVQREVSSHNHLHLHEAHNLKAGRPASCPYYTLIILKWKNEKYLFTATYSYSLFNVTVSGTEMSSKSYGSVSWIRPERSIPVPMHNIISLKWRQFLSTITPRMITIRVSGRTAALRHLLETMIRWQIKKPAFKKSCAFTFQNCNDRSDWIKTIWMFGPRFLL